MLTRPKHLTPENAAHFQHQSVVDRYHLRLPYPPGIFSTLSTLITDTPRVILDVGTGIGNLAIGMLPYAERIDAVDPSAAMLARAKTLPGGDDPRLNWIHGRAEDVALNPPYALIMGGESLHWLDWETAFPRFADLLTPNGCVAIVERAERPTSWSDQLGALIRRYSTMHNYEPYDLVEELEKRGVFTLVGRKAIEPMESRQRVDDYIASFHARSSLAQETMPPDDFAAFDGALRTIVCAHSINDCLTLHTEATVIWGKPHKPGV